MSASTPVACPEAGAAALQEAQPPSAAARAKREPHDGSAVGDGSAIDRFVTARARKHRQPDREPGLKRANFGRGAGLPTLLLLPQLLILLFFFFIPSLRALMQSVLLSDPFGTNVQF